MDEQHDVARLEEHSEADRLGLMNHANRVLQLPVHLVLEIGAIPCPDDLPSPLFAAASDWALLYRAKEGLAVRGFEDKEQLSACLTDVYRTAEIVAVLNKGKPVRFNMRVSARIG
jgi:hypothetical protein